MPRLTRAPQRYGLSLSGIPFFVNEDVSMWMAANGGSLFDAKGDPALESGPVLGMLEFWRKLKPALPPPAGRSSIPHDASRSTSG